MEIAGITSTQNNPELTTVKLPFFRRRKFKLVVVGVLLAGALFFILRYFPPLKHTSIGADFPWEKNPTDNPQSENKTPNMPYYPSKSCATSVIQEGSQSAYIITGSLKLALKPEDYTWMKENCPETEWIVKNPNPDLPTEYSIPSCVSQTEYFNTPPIEQKYITNITPLGNFNPGGGHVFPTDHIYFYLPKSNAADPVTNEKIPLEVAVYAPGDVWITSVRVSEHLSENPPYEDYSVGFSPCREFSGIYGHMTTLSENLKDALIPPYTNSNEYEAGGKRYRTYEKKMEIMLKAGEVIGTTGGRIGQNALDFTAINKRVDELQFANPARWDNIKKHAVCPLDYYASDTKAELELKLLDHEGEARVVEPICGELNQDIAGSAQGAWFVKGTTSTYPEDPHLTLAHDNFNPLLGVFSVGDSLAQSYLEKRVYYFKPNKTGLFNLDFSLVKTDNTIYCYEVGLNQGINSEIETTNVILLQSSSPTDLLIGGTKLKSCGRGPWQMDEKAIEFVR